MSFDKFLEGEELTAGTRVAKNCSICQNPQLAAEVLKFAEGKADGTISHSVHYVWVNYFAPEYGMGSPNTIRNHIRLHLGMQV